MRKTLLEIELQHETITQRRLGHLLYVWCPKQGLFYCVRTARGPSAVLAVGQGLSLIHS